MKYFISIEKTMVPVELQLEQTTISGAWIYLGKWQGFQALLALGGGKMNSIYFIYQDLYNNHSIFAICKSNTYEKSTFMYYFKK